MIDKLRQNARRPKEDEYGNAMLERMNLRHQELSRWGFSHLSVKGCKAALDIGCGGGKNLETMLKAEPGTRVCGIDYSMASVKKSIEVNQEAVRDGRAEITLGSVEKLPYEKESFSIATAFETVYYWPELEACFREVLRVLTPGGRFLICNEDSSLKGNEEIGEFLHMTFYTAEDLERLLLSAGFQNVKGHTHPNGKWICVVGEN